VDLPLVVFFVVGPALFLVVHAYVLLHFVLLADKAGVFHAELNSQIVEEETRTRLRRQLPSNIFVQFLAGPREVREGRVGLMLRLIAQITLLWGPLALLIFFLLQFLPHHSPLIAWWQRFTVICDLALLWMLWPSVARGEVRWITLEDFRRVPVVLIALGSLIPVVIIFFVITFPGEFLNDNWLSRLLLVPHSLLLEGRVDTVTQKPTSLWSNRLVLPGVDVVDHTKFDTEDKIKTLPTTLSLRGRRLEGAVLVGAILRKVDLTGAQLQGAILDEADLRDTEFGCGEQHNCANLQRASFVHARLPGAMLDYAPLQGAVLAYAQLEGASLSYAKLNGADLFGAELEGANLDSADLSEAQLLFAHLQGASLIKAQLKEADLYRPFVWRANAQNSKVEGIKLFEPERQGKYDFLSTSPLCQALECEWTADSYAKLETFMKESLTKPDRLQDSLDRIKKLGPEPPPMDVEKGELKVWNDLLSLTSAKGDYEGTLLERIVRGACEGTIGLYAVRGFARDLEFRFQSQSDKVDKFANSLLDKDRCPGALGLSDRDKDRLAKLRDRPNIPALAAAKQASPEGDLSVVLRTELTDPARASLAGHVDSPSVAMNGQVVFYTGNWYAALSIDGGKIFQYLDPFRAFPDPPNQSFCCDQVVDYIPSIDMFVWLLQYDLKPALPHSGNIVRLAFAKSTDVKAGKWRLYDISSKSIGQPSAYIDYASLAVGASNLYVTMNTFTSTGQSAGAAVMRIPFEGISSGQITEDHFVSAELNSFRVAQNCGTTAYFAAHQDTSTLAVFAWDEAQPQPVKSQIGVARWIGGSGYDSKDPDGTRWLDRLDSRITGATLTGNELWLAWSVNKAIGQKPQPFVQIARVNIQDMKLIENKNLSDPDSAIAYPALATNASNEVAVSYMIGGGTRYPSHAVAFLTGSFGRFTTSGDRGPRQGDFGGQMGDYLTVRPVFPDRRLFVAAGYTLRGKGDASGGDATPQVVIFGRGDDDTDDSATESRPGADRWPVKTGQDNDAELVGPTSKPTLTTVEDLVQLPRPTGLPPEGESPYPDQRAAPVERTVYRVEAKIISIRIEASGDYKLVLQGASGRTMIAAAPNPKVEYVGNSPWQKEMAEVRRQLDVKYFSAKERLGAQAAAPDNSSRYWHWIL
jgi:uncharacterized protein YjbI with pentapeptide repeats